MQTTILVLWLIPMMLCYFHNNGGHGFDIPQNCIAWGVAGLLIAIHSLVLPGKLTVTRYALKLTCTTWMFAGALLWSLPLLWSPDAVTRAEAIPHVAALWGFLLLLWTLRCQPRRNERLSIWLTIIWLAALVQGLFGFLQVTLFASEGGFAGSRPFGIFQQVNLLSSFVATGLACALLCANGQRQISSLRRTAIGFALLFMPFMLVLLQSRAGGIGAGLAAMILSAVSSRQPGARQRLVTQWALMLAGIALALLWQSGSLNSLLPHSASLPQPSSFGMRDTSGSTHERWRIIQNTWLMIREHPWLGTGYGGFEHTFAQTALAHGGGVVGQTLIHPHNELLYAWSEGGIFGLGGLLLMVAGILKGLWQRGGMRWAGLALLLPIAVHMNLEYPLYQSVPHGVVLTLLLSLALPPVHHPESVSQKVQRSGHAVRLMLMAIGISLMAFMAGTLQTQQALTRIERQNMAPLVQNEQATLDGLWAPQAFATRIDYDRHIALLMRYNQTRDVQQLVQFAQWAPDYLSRHNDPNVMASLLTITRALSPAKVNEICLEAHKLWPGKPGFHC